MKAGARLPSRSANPAELAAGRPRRGGRGSLAGQAWVAPPGGTPPVFMKRDTPWLNGTVTIGRPPSRAGLATDVSYRSWSFRFADGRTLGGGTWATWAPPGSRLSRIAARPLHMTVWRPERVDAVRGLAHVLLHAVAGRPSVTRYSQPPSIRFG